MGDVYSMIDEAVAYILSKINVEYIIKHVKREERPELPEEALREALVNALAHRDYRSTANVQVYIFQDRVEIVSPGGLPAGMTEADLGVKSIPRNPLLFSVLHRMEAVENIGSGIKRILTLCRDYGVAEPKIKVAQHWFTMVFQRVIDQATEQVTEQVLKPLVAVGEQTLSGLELMNAVGLRHRPTFLYSYLHPALEKGLIEMTIPEKPRSRSQRYRLTAKGRHILETLEQE